MPSRLLGGVCVRVRTCAPWRRRDSVIWEQSSYLAKEEKGQNLSAPHEGICHVRQEDAGSPGAGCFPDFLLLGSGLCVQRALVLPSLPLLRLHLCPPPSRRPLPNSLLVTTATEHLPSPPNPGSGCSSLPHPQPSCHPRFLAHQWTKRTPHSPSPRQETRRPDLPRFLENKRGVSSQRPGQNPLFLLPSLPNCPPTSFEALKARGPLERGLLLAHPGGKGPTRAEPRCWHRPRCDHGRAPGATSGRKHGMDSILFHGLIQDWFRPCGPGCKVSSCKKLLLPFL